MTRSCPQYLEHEIQKLSTETTLYSKTGLVFLSKISRRSLERKTAIRNAILSGKETRI